MSIEKASAWLTAINLVVQVVEGSLRIKDRQNNTKVADLEKRVAELEAKLKEK